jgi:acetyltransferase-like isoleucine patch superfamily enzyme
MTQEFYHHISNEKIASVEIITPEEFANKSTQNLQGFSYMVSFTLDKQSRTKTINQLDDLDSAIYIHDTVIFPGPTSDTQLVKKIIGKGSFIGPLTFIMLNSTIGRHCIIEAGSGISHYVQIGNNVIVHPGVLIAGRTLIGNNCEFNMKSSTLPKIEICNDVCVGALTTVTKNITTPGMYSGTIARRVGDWDLAKD